MVSRSPQKNESLKSTGIKVVFFDLDGTLIGKSGVISEKDLQALSKLKKQGITIAIASGRSIPGIRSLQKQIGFNGMSSLGAGSIIYDPVDDVIVESATFEFEKRRAMWSTLKNNDFYVEVYTHRDTFISDPHPYALIHGEYMDIPITVEREANIFHLDDFVKFIVMVDSRQELDRLRSLLAAIPDIAVGVASGAKHPGISFVNITDSRADRNIVFKKILQMGNVEPHEVMSFGDSESDRIFIENAGVGVAMKDAPDAVKRVANMVCNSVEESGVSQFLHQFFNWN